MDPITIGAILAGGTKLIGSGLGALSTNKQNKKSREFQLEQWHRQNAYNHPQQQMQRLKEAKLNPNLIYGSSANTGNAQAVGTPKFESINTEGIKDSGAATVNAYYDTALKTAQANNLEADNNVKIQQAAKIAVDTQQSGAQTAKTKAETDIIKQYSADAQKASIANTQAQTRSIQDSNQRAWQNQPLEIQKRTLDLVTKSTGNRYTEEQIKLAIAQTKLKKIEGRLAQEGIGANDPAWLKLIVLNKELIIKELEKLFN